MLGVGSCNFLAPKEECKRVNCYILSCIRKTLSQTQSPEVSNYLPRLHILQCLTFGPSHRVGYTVQPFGEGQDRPYGRRLRASSRLDIRSNERVMQIQPSTRKSLLNQYAPRCLSRLPTLECSFYIRYPTGRPGKPFVYSGAYISCFDSILHLYTL